MSEPETMVMRVQKNIVMRTFGYLFILGGIIRLFADEQLFAVFMIRDAWSDHPYFIYIYRVLGGFVILSGLVIIQISKRLDQYQKVMHALKWGFLVLGTVMLAGGILGDLAVYLFLPDAVFVFGLAVLFDLWGKPGRSAPPANKI